MYRRGRDSSPMGDSLQAFRDRSRSPPRRHYSPGRDGARPPAMNERRFSRGRDDGGYDYRESHRGESYGRYDNRAVCSMTVQSSITSELKLQTGL